MAVRPLRKKAPKGPLWYRRLLRSLLNTTLDSWHKHQPCCPRTPMRTYLITPYPLSRKIQSQNTTTTPRTLALRFLPGRKFGWSTWCYGRHWMCPTVSLTSLTLTQTNSERELSATSPVYLLYLFPPRHTRDLSTNAQTRSRHATSLTRKMDEISKLRFANHCFRHSTVKAIRADLNNILKRPYT